MKQWLVVPVILLALLPDSARSDECERCGRLEERLERMESDNRTLRARVEWLRRLLYATEESMSASVMHVTAPAPGQVPPAATKEHRQRLEAIPLPGHPSKDQVREYVARILATAQYRGGYSVYDLEIKMLKRVGSENADVLVEPLVYVGRLDTAIYLTEALKALASDGLRGLILKNLAAAPDLVEVVLARGWAQEAAPILLKTLSARSPYMTTRWVEAAVQVCGPEHYPDLRFQLAYGLNPWNVWRLIRDLPGMEPLDAFVADAWLSTKRRKGSWQWKQLAAVAANYGHVAGLGELARGADGDLDWWREFQKLTAYEGGSKGALLWFERNKEHLAFDRTMRVYVQSSD